MAPCSEPGLFVTVDGPSGCGKSTVVALLAELLRADGRTVHTTAEPSTGPIGALCRELTESVTGHALACLYGADRYHHVHTEIRPRLAAGEVVISDRYVASGLVMQGFDGISPTYLWQLNAEADRPDLAVILRADPAVIAARLAARGTKNRFQRQPDSTVTEVELYRAAIGNLVRAGFPLLVLDITHLRAEQVAEVIRERLARP